MAVGGVQADTQETLDGLPGLSYHLPGNKIPAGATT
ncbi:hypothetical protein HNQ77_003431 [Silvibacterium bohemicum]|uniref:Uncharacterized protein n=1 Tax=Silvibacterium bohemicum TaxID=1577686 RepID=A0A841JWE5_9BACT|nr:hypothetical protein [Silvibacterium bohemicum]